MIFFPFKCLEINPIHIKRKKDVLGIIIESEDACTLTRAFQKPHLMEDAQDTFSCSFCAEGSKKECSYDGAGNCEKKVLHIFMGKVCEEVKKSLYFNELKACLKNKHNKANVNKSSCDLLLLRTRSHEFFYFMKYLIIQAFWIY